MVSGQPRGGSGACPCPSLGPIPHPFTDDPAFDVTEGQTGSVWFLGAPFGTVDRTCSIPQGKILFVGLLNAEDSGLEDPGSTASEQLASAQSQADLIQSVSFSLDDVSITNIGSYRVQSPQFTFTAPTPWLFGDTGGTSTSVSDGYFVMLAPLAPGTHTIHYTGTIPGLRFDTEHDLSFNRDSDQWRFSRRRHSLRKDLRGVFSGMGGNGTFSLPTTNSPIQDTAPISTGQNGSVWYLGGTFTSGSSPETRVRSGHMCCRRNFAVFPHSRRSGRTDTDCPNPDNFDTETLRGFIQGYMDSASNMTCTIDGVPVADLTNAITSQYRVQSPVFSYTTPAAHNCLSDVLGAVCYTNSSGTPFTIDGAVADGVYLMVAPLAVGQHTIHFTGSLSGGFRRTSPTT